MRSYITEAIDVKTEKDIKAPTATDVEDFIADAEKAQEERAFETDLAETAMKKGAKAAKAKVMYKPADARGCRSAGRGGAAGEAVYESYQARC